MLRLRLEDGDLDRVVVAADAAPLLELADVTRHPSPFTSAVVSRHIQPHDVALLRVLLSGACTPGFLQPHLTDADEAVEAVVSVTTDRAERDIADNIAAGYLPHGVLVELTSSGRAGVSVRRHLETVLRRAVRDIHEILEGSGRPAPRAWAAAVQARLDHQDPDTTFAELGPHVRHVDGDLQIDLRSGAEVSAVSPGTGIVLVPTTADYPSVTVSSSGAPTVISVPTADIGIDPMTDDAPPALTRLLGSTRARLLVEITLHPDGIRALARRTDLAPATVSEHVKALREAGLVVHGAPGTDGSVTHTTTSLGHRLIRGR